jgi:hypothetical protein
MSFNVSRACKNQNKLFDSFTLFNLSIPAIVFEILLLFTFLRFDIMIWIIVGVIVGLLVIDFILCRKVEITRNRLMDIAISILSAIIGYLDWMFLGSIGILIFVVFLLIAIF